MSIQCRCTKLGSLFVNTISQSAIVQLGDSDSVKLTTRALAVQRAIPDSKADEFRFASYPIFFRPPFTIQLPPVTTFNSNSPLAEIRIDSVETLGVAASSYLRVGCGGPLKGETRIKHIRHFNDRDIS